MKLAKARYNWNRSSRTLRRARRLYYQTGPLQAIDPQSHDAPLVELVRRLGGGRTLRERVIALRWRRKRGKQNGANGEIPVEADREMDHNVSSLAAESGAAPANFTGDNQQKEVGCEQQQR